MIVKDGQYNPATVADALQQSGLDGKARAERDSFGLVPGHTVHTTEAASTGTRSERPAKERKPECDRLTIDILQCELLKRCYSVRFNMITNEIEVDAESESGRAMDFDDTVTMLHSNLCTTFKGCTLDTISAYLAFIAKEQPYNPVLEMLGGATWDGRDRLPDLYALMGIDEDELSRVLVQKWLLQSVAMLYNDLQDPYGIDGVLVLNGAQGVGKTSLFRHLAMRPAWFLEGAAINDHDKDTKRRIVTRWIAELGEVESTMKSDVAALKAFITQDVDSYRLPYARSDRKVARRTSLCATCNSDRYLIDPTGNRRWWSVPIYKRMEYTEICQLDALQLWAQIYAVVNGMTRQERTACYRLTAREQYMLAVRNGDFEKPVKGELECRDIIDDARSRGEQAVWAYMTVTQWMQEHDALRRYTAEQISTALNKIGIEMKRKRINGERNASKTYELPTAFTTDGAHLRAIK